MKLSDLISAEQVKAEALENPAVRAEWDRTAVAREVAHRVLRYRVEHGLSQTELGSRLGVPSPTWPSSSGGTRRRRSAPSPDWPSGWVSSSISTSRRQPCACRRDGVRPACSDRNGNRTATT